MEPRRAKHLSATGTITVAASGAHAILDGVVIGTGAASAVLTINETGTGNVVSVIDASAKGYYRFDGLILNGGFTAVLAGGNADVTVIYG